MKNLSKKYRLGLSTMVAAASLFMAGAATASAFDGGIPAGWAGVGNYGVLGADGVVTVSPEGGNYGWVASNTGITGLGLSIGGTDGTRLRSNVFSAAAGDNLEFYFNYVTSDGAGFADYAWSRLLDSSLNEVAVLFTARTTPAGNSVPGFGMPAISATMLPAFVSIIPGGPSWTPLGTYSGQCFNIEGCGYSGWVESDYTILNAGNYILEFGVVDWSDQIYDSGLAFDGITVAGVPIDDGTVPEPGSLALLGLGLAGLTAIRRRKT